VPVWFKVVKGREEGSLRDVMTLLYGANHELARILASNLGLGLKDALHVAEDAVARFAQEVEEAGRDARLKELFEAREAEGGGEVVVELAENSTCKTCGL